MFLLLMMDSRIPAMSSLFKPFHHFVHFILDSGRITEFLLGFANVEIMSDASFVNLWTDEYWNEAVLSAKHLREEEPE